jgi:hypothetical protein
LRVQSAWLTAVLVLTAVAGGVARAQDAPAAAGARVHLVGAGDAAPDLEARLRDLLGDVAPALEITRETTFAVERLFRVDDADGAWPTAWLVLDGPRARVRAAGAGRTRFVFRDLDVGQPLTEFDRERLGLTVKAALATLVAGGPGALTLVDAAAASGVVLPKQEVPPPAIALPATDPPEPTFGLGAVFQVEGRAGGFAPGLALVGTLRGSDWRGAPELSLMVGYRPAKFYGNQSAGLVVQAHWVRATLSYKAAKLARLGVGLGVDREWTTWAGGRGPDDYDNWLPAARLFARWGPVRSSMLQVSGTGFVELTRAIEYPVFTDDGFYESPYRPSSFVVGLSIEVWWR